MFIGYDFLALSDNTFMRFKFHLDIILLITGALVVLTLIGFLTDQFV